MPRPPRKKLDPNRVIKHRPGATQGGRTSLKIAKLPEGPDPVAPRVMDAVAVRHEGPDPAIVAQVLERMANGETQAKILASGSGMPSRGTWNRWVLAHEDLRAAWQVARKLKAGSLFEEALDLARDLKEGRKAVTATEVNALRVAIETLKWSASKLDPGVYGDNLVKTPAIAIQINSTLDLGGRNGENQDGIYQFAVRIPDAPAAAATAEPLRAGAHKRGARASGTRLEATDEP